MHVGTTRTPKINLQRNRAAPSDHGLTHLGLVLETIGWMQLAGAAVAATSLFLMATIRPGPFSYRPEIGELEEHMFLGSVLALLGAALLVVAGRGLSVGSASAAKVYVVGGAICGVAFVFTLGSPNPLVVAAGIVAALAWPLVVMVAVKRRPASSNPLFPGRFKDANDRGLAGVSALMAMFASVELIAAGGAIWFAFGGGDTPLVQAAMIVLIVGLLVRAGAQFLGALELQRSGSRRMTRLYIWLSFLAAGAFIAASLASTWSVQWCVFILGAAGVLLAWPYVLKRFVARLADSKPTEVASDGGLMAIGWVVLLLGIHGSLAHGFGLVVGISSGTQITLFETSETVLAIAQLWLGIELVALTSRTRLAALAYAAAGIATASLLWREFATVAHRSPSPDGLGMVGVAATVALPVVSAILIFTRERKTT